MQRCQIILFNTVMSPNSNSKIILRRYVDFRSLIIHASRSSRIAVLMKLFSRAYTIVFTSLIDVVKLRVNMLLLTLFSPVEI